jgi:hypothetical protein
MRVAESQNVVEVGGGGGRDRRWNLRGLRVTAVGHRLEGGEGTAGLLVTPDVRDLQSEGPALEWDWVSRGDTGRTGAASPQMTPSLSLRPLVTRPWRVTPIPGMPPGGDLIGSRC